MFARVIRFRLTPGGSGLSDHLARQLDEAVVQQMGPPRERRVLRAVSDPGEVILLFLWEGAPPATDPTEGFFERVAGGAMGSVAVRTDELYEVVASD